MFILITPVFGDRKDVHKYVCVSIWNTVYKDLNGKKFWRNQVLNTSNVKDVKTAPTGPVVEDSPGVWEVMGSIPGQVKPKTLKMVLGASFQSARQVRSRKYVWFPCFHL